MLINKRLISVILALAACLILSRPEIVAGDNLPPPIVTANSVEICLNSRYSQHTLSKTPASAQQMSNILWAAGKAPVTGAYRNIYLATSTATYLYEPLGHSLTWYSNDKASDGSFAIIYESALDFDAGLSFMPALLASVSLARSTELAVAGCPKALGYPKTRLFFGVQAVKGLTADLAARCSVPQGQPGWLPDPSTAGDNSLEGVLADLKYVNSFTQTLLTPQQISQILWAGYGCTAHTTSNSRAGLTVPSAYANYFLSRSIYLVNEIGVHRYHNRNPATNPATRDHRIEQLTPAGGGPQPRSVGDSEQLQSADPRLDLRSAVVGLPQAPCYVILCHNASYAGQDLHYAQLETGFVAGNMLIQASAIGLGCHFKSNLTPAQQKSIQTVANIPASNVPQAIVSIGPMAATVSISVALQGDPPLARPDVWWVVPLNVRFFSPGADVLNDAPTYQFNLTTTKSAAGDMAVCTAAPVAPGTYDITVIGDHSLINVKRSVVILAPSTSVDLGTILEGNANQDTIVDLDDYVLLSSSWLSSESQAEYDARTDFDRNGLINAYDLSLLAANWLRTSPIEISP
jgi:hypothetical protein